MSKHTILLLSLLFCLPTMAQTPWRTVDSLVKAKAYADTYTLLEQNYTYALQNGQSYDLLRAAYSMAVVGDNLPKKINSLTILQRTLPLLDPAEKALCHTLIASIYAQELRNRSEEYRYRYDTEAPCHSDPADTVYKNWCRERLADSIMSHSSAALRTADTLLLQSKRVADYHYLTLHDTVNDYSALTLYEAVHYAAVHNIEGTSLLFTDAGFVYSDSLYHALCDPFALARMPLPQGGTTMYKLMILKNTARFLIRTLQSRAEDYQLLSHGRAARVPYRTGTDTSSVQWHTLCRELNRFVDHYTGGYQKEEFKILRPKPLASVEIGPVVAPDSGCFFTYNGDSCATLYMRILPDIRSTVDTMEQQQRLRYALSLPALHDFVVSVQPTTEDQWRNTKHYHFPPLPVGDYSMLVAEKPFPVRTDIADSCLPAAFLYSFSCQSAAIEPIIYSDGQGVVLNTITGEPLVGIPVTLRGELQSWVGEEHDSITLTAYTDTLGRFDFGPLMPEGKYTHPIYSITHQGHTCTRKQEQLIANYRNPLMEEEEEADTIVSFFLNAPIYRPSDTVRFTAMVQQRSKSTGANLQPVPHFSFCVKMADGYDRSDSITSLNLTTDDMGWAEGSIILSQMLSPNKSYDHLYLIGYDHDASDIGYAVIPVENYMLPTLSLSLQSTSDTHRYGQPVYIEGMLTSRSGASISSATVSYTLTQSFGHSPWSNCLGNEHRGCWFVNSSGELPIQPDGSFSFHFTPIKYEYLPYLDGEFAQYRLEVTATDPTGETVKEDIYIAVGDYTGFFSLSPYSPPSYDITGGGLPEYIDGLGDIHVHCSSLNNRLLAVAAHLTIETDAPTPTLVWQGDLSVPNKWGPLSNLIPNIVLPDGHLRFFMSSDNPHIHPDTLRVSHLGFDAPMPLDTLPFFASVEKDKYLVGDTLRVRVGSAENISAMLLLSQGSRIIQIYHLRLDHGFTRIALPLEEKWCGDIGISVIAYHHGERFKGSTNINVARPLPRLQMHWIEPDGLNVTPFKPDFHIQRLFAGAPVHWRLRFTDTLGKPVQTTLTLTSYDDALHSIENHYGQTFYSNVDYLSYHTGYCSFGDPIYDHNRLLLNTVRYNEPKQRPFFELRPPYSSHDQSTRAYYIDQPKIDALLSVGTYGYYGVHCASASVGTYEDWNIDNLPQPKGILRTDLSPYGPWFGNLHSDNDGIIDLRFTAPQRLARWFLRGVAMDREGSLAYIDNSYLTYRDVMITPNVPPFLYTGDSTSMVVRIDRMDGDTLGGIAVRLYSGTKAKGERYTEALPEGGSLVQFPLVAPHKLLPLASRHRDYSFTVSDALHDEIVLDAQSATVNLLRHPRLNGNAYPLTQSDYRTLQSRAEDYFYWKERDSYSICPIFHSLYCAAVYHDSHAVDSLLKVLDEAQLPSGGWPSFKGSTRIYDKRDIRENLKDIMRIQKECPHVRIPQSFKIRRTLQLYDSLMYKDWKRSPGSRNDASSWLTIHDHFAQYPLDSIYLPMRDSLYANIRSNNPDQWDILLLNRHGDTALARKMARAIVQSSSYDSNHPEQGRRWNATDNSASALLNYIDIFEEVLHDTILADQVRQRVRYLLPTTVWNGDNRARLTSRGLIRDPQWYKKQDPGNVTLTREVIPHKNLTTSNTPYGQYTIRLTVNNERPLYNLYIRSPYAACFSSHGDVNVVYSSSEKTYAISTKTVDSRLGSIATQFVGAPDCLDIFIYNLPAGIHTLEYTVTADRTGRFHLPPATIQCLALPWHEAKKGLLQAATPAETILR